MAVECKNMIYIYHEDSEMIRKAAKAFNDGKLLDFFESTPDDLDSAGAEMDNCGNKVDVYKAVKQKYFEAYFITESPVVEAVEMAADELGFEPMTYYYYVPGDWIAGVWQCGEERTFDLHFVGYLVDIFGISALWSSDKKEVEGEAEKVVE